MKLILDTNILISALIKDSAVRKALLNPVFEFYLPEFSLEEIEEHMDLIAARSRLSKEEIYLVLNMLLVNIHIVPSEQILRKYEEADRLMGKIDKKDVPFIASALSIPNEGIWTEDKHFLKQKRVKIWCTKNIISISRKKGR
ncbi:MAG: PIN domain-containing protein [Candidatus Geothermarchaeales archaeon]